MQVDRVHPQSLTSLACTGGFGDRGWSLRRQVAVRPPGLLGIVRRGNLGTRRAVAPQDLDARLLLDGMAAGRLPRRRRTRTIAELGLIPDEIIARLADERSIFEPRPDLGHVGLRRRFLGVLRALLLVRLPVAVTTATAHLMVASPSRRLPTAAHRSPL
jgi:hypothetical protein